MHPLLEEMAITTGLLLETQGLTEVLQRLAIRASEVTDADYGALATFNEDGRLERFVYHGIDEDTARRMGAPPTGKGLLGALATSDAPIRVDDVMARVDFSGWPDAHPAMGPFLGVPIRAQDRTIGSVYVGRDRGRDPFDDHDEASATFLALQAATCIASAMTRERDSRVALLEERASIARDLHDGTIQELYALGLQFDAHARRPDLPAETSQMLRAGVERINEVIRDIRSYIQMLESTLARSVPDLAHDIPAALRQLVPAGVDTVFNLSAAALQEISSRSAEDLLYITREALSNAVRHGRPTRLAVDIRQTPDEIALTIQDNGSGFDPATARRGLGTVSMRTRAERLGGEFTLIGIPGMGTMVRVSIRRHDIDESD